MSVGLNEPTTPYQLVPPASGQGPSVVAVTRAEGAAHGLLVWHICETGTPESVSQGMWVASGIGLHTVPSGTDDLDHLTIRASLFWSDCCGLHGWVTDGKWVAA